MRSSVTESLPILVVDDDDQMLRTIGDLLRFKGYRPVGAPTGRAGLEAATRMTLPPAIALVDLRLPDMDGIELVAHLHAVSDLTEVVILTGNASLDSAVRALREQSYDYLVKPVQPEFLLSSIDRAAERWRRKSAEAAMRETQERLRRVFDHVRDALFITNDAGEIVDANPAATALADAPVETLRTLTIDAVLGAPIVHEMHGSGSVEYRTMRSSGTPRVVDVQSAAFAPGMFVHAVRDLSERRRLEEELHQSRKMDAIGRLAGGVAHDINNVLTAITCYSEILLGSIDEADERRADVAEIRSAAQRAAALTGQLLAFSRKQVLQPRVVDLNAVVGDIERMLARMIGEDVAIAIDRDPELWPVRADPGQIGQVVMNLAVNARDAMPHGGTLSITTKNVHLEQPVVLRHGTVDPGDYVMLRVTDQGTGMSDDVLAHLFEPFFTTKGHGKGTGLGLSTVYGIITQSNGKIEVLSRRDAGTSVTIYLPREQDADVVAPVSVPAAPVTTGAARETILLVEDDDALRGLMLRLLERQGYRVLAAGDADGALASAEAHLAELDIVVIDVVMPGMNGRELAEQLIARRPQLKVLYMSGYTDDALLHRGVSTLQRTLLQKPFTTEALMLKIREVLDTPATLV